VRPSVQGVAIRTGILSDMPLLSYQLCGNPMTLEDGSHVSACAGRLPFAPER
jgi:hypothetical protein